MSCLVALAANISPRNLVPCAKNDNGNKRNNGKRSTIDSTKVDEEDEDEAYAATATKSATVATAATATTTRELWRCRHKHWLKAEGWLCN